MARTRHQPVRITNVHPVPRTCGICPAPITNGQGAYVTADDAHATHTACPA